MLRIHASELFLYELCNLSLAHVSFQYLIYSIQCTCMCLFPLQNVLIFITTGDDKGAGMFMLAGKEDDLNTLGPK